MVFKSISKETTDLAITVYNANFAVVKEKRDFRLYDQDETIHYMNVSEQIETDSIIIKGLSIRELNFDHDLVDKHKLLKKYIDQTVYLYNPKIKLKVEYRLLSVDGGIILENTNTNEIVIDPEEEVILPKLPEGLIVKPSLIWKVRPQRTREIDVTYTTGGLQWNANYVIYLHEQSLDLTGWVLLENNTGSTFKDARLKLVAGDVNKTTNLPNHSTDYIVYDQVDADYAFEEKSFNDYHLYTLQEKTTLKSNQEKQINLLDVSNIQYKKYYECEYGDDQVNIILEFQNTKENQLGMPFPKGKVKVYSQDTDDGDLEFIGEDRISHTPKEEPIRLQLGQAFDIVCDSRETDSYREGKLEYYTFEYEIKNHKEQAISMKVKHPLRQKFSEIAETTHDYRKVDTRTIEFLVEVPANEKETIRFGYVVDHSINVSIR
ncbi:DUF4139 domain-containing protein [Virgibacillus byunsanensis]|uniref:DUF4139 domain-containing protein n=1 Tax=Virgibacillus byunsanensis TaxID=570945 RepID=A0ABW3LNM6_9BACI